MKIIKRDGSEVEFNKAKIVKAILSANNSVSPDDTLPVQEAENIGLMCKAPCCRALC